MPGKACEPEVNGADDEDELLDEDEPRMKGRPANRLEACRVDLTARRNIYLKYTTLLTLTPLTKSRPTI